MICWVLAMEMLQGVWKQHLRPRAVVGYGVKIVLPSPPNYVTRSPGLSRLIVLYFASRENSLKLFDSASPGLKISDGHDVCLYVPS